MARPRTRPEWARLYVQAGMDPDSVSKRDKAEAEKQILKWLAPTDEEFVRVGVHIDGEMYVFNIHHDNHYRKGEQCYCGEVKKIDKVIT